MPERSKREPTTAKEALELVQKGKAEYRSMEHADPYTDATSNSVIIQGIMQISNEMLVSNNDISSYLFKQIK